MKYLSLVHRGVRRIVAAFSFLKTWKGLHILKHTCHCLVLTVRLKLGRKFWTESQFNFPSKLSRKGNAPLCGL